MLLNVLETLQAISPLPLVLFGIAAALNGILDGFLMLVLGVAALKK